MLVVYLLRVGTVVHGTADLGKICKIVAPSQDLRLRPKEQRSSIDPPYN